MAANSWGTVGLIVVFIVALIVSLISEIRRRGGNSILRTVWEYLSYYTVQTNILVLVWLCLRNGWPDTALGEFALDDNVSAAVTFYIFTVGVANYGIFGWQPLPVFERLSDLLTHAITPALTLVYWFIAVDKTHLMLSSIGLWLCYPLAYALYTLVHGPFSKFYPYDFANLQVLGAKRITLNLVMLSLSLVVAGSLFILVGQSM